MAYVYHLCAPDLQGEVIYPLNDLKARFPDIYARERPKYDGRESVMSYRVPLLDIPWADTVNLSALDPRLLVAARRRLGVPCSRLLERRLARIPVERIAHQPAVVYDSATHWLNSLPGEDVPTTPPAAEFTSFDPAGYEELTEVPERHLDYLTSQLERGQPALGFVFVRHVLVVGPVDVSGIELMSL